MLSANASMYSIIPSIFWLLYQSFCFSLFRSSAFHFLFSCSIPLCELYVNRLHTIFFNKFPASSLSFLLFFCLSFTAGQKKTPRFLFSAEFSFRFCFTPNRAPQGSPAWSSHSAPSLPFFSGRYTQWKAPTFPQSADGSS